MAVFPWRKGVICNIQFRPGVLLTSPFNLTPKPDVHEADDRPVRLPANDDHVYGDIIFTAVFKLHAMKSGMRTIRGPNEPGIILIHNQVIGLMPPDPGLKGDSCRLRIAEMSSGASQLHGG